MCCGYHIWSKEALMQAENDDDLDGGQRSSEVKWGKLCAMATIFGQKKHWCKLRMMMTLMEVKWGKLCAMATIFGQKKHWCKLRMMMTLMEIKGHQRSNGVNCVLWLPYLVKRSPDASWEWWWPWWRSKVIRGQMGQTMCYGYHIWSKEALMQAENDDDLYGGQRSSEVKWGKLCDMTTIFGQ